MANLALDVLEVGKVLGLAGGRRPRARQELGVAQMIESLDEVVGRQNVEIIAGPSRPNLGPAGTADAEPEGIGSPSPPAGTPVTGDRVIEGKRAQNVIAADRVVLWRA
jgi:hypothetical protein